MVLNSDTKITPLYLEYCFFFQENVLDDFQAFFEDLEKLVTCKIITYGGWEEDVFTDAKRILQQEIPSFLNPGLKAADLMLTFQKKTYPCHLDVRLRSPFLCTFRFSVTFIEQNDSGSTKIHESSFQNSEELRSFMEICEETVLRFIERSKLKGLIDNNSGHALWTFMIPNEKLCNKETLLKVMYSIKNIFDEQEGPKKWFKMKYPNSGLPNDKEYATGGFSILQNKIALISHFTPHFKGDERIDRYKYHLFSGKNNINFVWHISDSIKTLSEDRYRLDMAIDAISDLKKVLSDVNKEYKKISISKDEIGDTKLLDIYTQSQILLHGIYDRKNRASRRIQIYELMNKNNETKEIPTRLDEKPLWDSNNTVFNFTLGINRIWYRETEVAFQSLSKQLDQLIIKMSDLLRILEIRSSQSVQQIQNKLLEAINQNITFTDKTRSKIEILSIILSVFVIGEITSNIVVWYFTSFPEPNILYTAVMAIIIVLGVSIIILVFAIRKRNLI